MKTLLLNTAAAAALAFGMSAALAQTSGSGSGSVDLPPPASSGGASGSMSGSGPAPSGLPNRAQNEMPPASTKGGASAQGEMKSGAGKNAEKQGGMQSGRAAAPKELTTEQRTVIRDRVISRADRVNMNFNVSVGAVVPQTVHTHLHPLPAELVEIYPSYRGYSYIVLADGRLVIIEPKTYEVVTIVTI